MKSFLYGVLTGAILMTICCCLIFSLKQKERDQKEVTVTQVSGEKIEHKEFNYTGSSIKFGTKSEGKGEIITEIPKTNIPEARAWMQNNNAVMLELLLTEKKMYGLSYLKRWNNISAGGGVIVSEKKFEGIKLQAQYWFSL